ncbi:MurR/RpiR family transcriptional regulator [Clostridium intestinale]|uniref:Transcriptional regulator, RpiR family protein n=1 Tax=Clostridium intestinale URNW TaxID=1294142 RepID=U2NQS9_9CLOT|nr:MurR/RpiR family transcriptional regulator [Clostridium intestinale]ERK31221.1 transcriptional regulator, RpiR family protein [Clostridium intestinale URNW]
MLLINRMENASLTRIEKDIAQYIIEHKEEIEKLSTHAIAKGTYTSSSAVIRLAHKLGFEGYNDLKKRYLEEQAYLNSNFQNIDVNIPFSQDNNIMSVAGAIKEVMIES